MRSQVQVGVCLRPLVEAEIENGAKTAVEIVGKNLVFNNTIGPSGYDFEFMFGPSSSQTRNIYDRMISPLIDHFFQGFTATVFAYGQTGSGKTYLMGSGPVSAPTNSRPPSPRGLSESGLLRASTSGLRSSTLGLRVSTSGNDCYDNQITSAEMPLTTGIIPFSLDDIFKKKSQLEAEGARVHIEMSYIEIYQEECYDLLSFMNVNPRDVNKENWRGNNKNTVKSKTVSLEMRENSKGETLLEGLSSWPVDDHLEVHRLLTAATRARATGKTAMNARSSRSHALATLSLRITLDGDKNSSIFSPTRGTSTTIVTSKLHLVDLAGSERVGKTLATGELLREGVSINRGLLTLGKVVSALNEQQLQSTSTNSAHTTTHIPYRESKLTRLLKDALGGNGMTVMLACCSPADSQFKETLDTLRFATRASAIVNNAKQGVDQIVTDLPPFVCYSCGAVNPCSSEAIPPSSPKGTKRERDTCDNVEFDANQSLKQFDDDNEEEEEEEEEDDDSEGSSDDEDDNRDDEDKENHGVKGKGKGSVNDETWRLTGQSSARIANGADNIATNLFRSSSGDKKKIVLGACQTGMRDQCTPAKVSLSPQKPEKGISPLQIRVDLPAVSVAHLSPATLLSSPTSSVQYRSPTRPLSLSPIPEMISTSVLLATLETRANEIHVLNRKLQRSEAERLVAENRLRTLQGKFLQIQTDREENAKPKKRKTVIQRVVEAVSCNVDRRNVYSPKGKVMSPRAF